MVLEKYAPDSALEKNSLAHGKSRSLRLNNQQLLGNQPPQGFAERVVFIALMSDKNADLGPAESAQAVDVPHNTRIVLVESDKPINICGTEEGGLRERVQSLSDLILSWLYGHKAFLK
jgi:hypothetical protein